MGIDTMIRKHPACGVIITGDFNQLNDNFRKVHYRFVQVVNVVTRGQATLDKIWTNMNGFYSTPVSISELGTSDHCMVLWKPDRGSPDIRGNVTRVTVKCMGPSAKAAFAMGVASIRWEPLFRLTTCEEKYSYYQTIFNNLIEHCFPIKTVTRHTADKPWITDLFRNLIRKMQRAYKSGNRDEYRVLRNMVNRESTKLKFEFYQKHILAISESGSRDWWKNMKKIMGLNGNSNSDMEELAKKTTDGDFAELANIMNYFFCHLPRLDKYDNVFTVHEALPYAFIISVHDTVSALRKVKTNKSTGPDNIPAWVLNEHADCLEAPLASMRVFLIVHCGRELFPLCGSSQLIIIIPLPKTKPLMSVNTDIRPLSITPIAAKVFESIIMKYVDDIVCDAMDSKQFGGIAGMSTTDALVEMTHIWYEATDILNTYVRLSC